MLAVPDERPLSLEAVEHLEICIIPSVSRTDGKLHSMNDKRERGARMPRSIQLGRNNLECDCVSRGTLPADSLRRHLHEVNQSRPVQVRRQRAEVGQPYTQLRDRTSNGRPCIHLIRILPYAPKSRLACSGPDQ